MRPRHALLLVYATVVPAEGCGAQVLDAGSNDAGPPVGHRRDFPPPSHSFGCTPGHENTDCYGTLCTGDVPPDLAGPWIGQLADVRFPSGSSMLRIEIMGSRSTSEPSPYRPSDIAICGRVIFGTAPEPPVATDPAAWPPGAPPSPVTTLSERPVEGFRYEFWQLPSSLAVDPAGTIPVQIGLYSRQFYKSWCELQYSYAQPSPSATPYRWACLPPPKPNVDTGCSLFVGSSVDLDAKGGWGAQAAAPRCAQPDLCFTAHACDCWDGGCSIDNGNLYSRTDIPLDLRLVPSANSGTGTITWDGSSHAVTLVRTP
jgi:hypothetical protein